MENIGKRLKEKRLELGLTVEDISSKTRLTQKHIKALEEGNLKFFHDDLSYLRFFVKSYCEAVDIDFEDIKDELRESVNDYTQTISLSTIHDHEVIEKSVANSEKLTKVQSDDARKTHVRKHAHSHINAKNIKKVDFSLVSLVAVVSVVAIVIVFGLVMYFKSVENTDTNKTDKQPIANEQNKNGNNSYPTTDEEDNKKDNEETKEMSVTKNDVTHYTIDNTKDGDDLKFEVYFGGSNSGFSMTVDGVVLSEPAARVYNYQTTATGTIKAKKGSKVQIYIGWVYDTSIKINGKNVKIDDTIVRSAQQATLEFTITGEE
ncbi:helix-turn-helix domain-containing protein [Amedibacillus sp. YH-ame10]